MKTGKCQGLGLAPCKSGPGHRLKSSDYKSYARHNQINNSVCGEQNMHHPKVWLCSKLLKANVSVVVFYEITTSGVLTLLLFIAQQTMLSVTLTLNLYLHSKLVLMFIDRV